MNFTTFTGKESPLRQAKDALVFDNSDMGLEEQFERIHDYAQRVIGRELEEFGILLIGLVYY